MTHHGDGEVDIGYATQDVRNQVAILKARRVTTKGTFVVGATINVIEDWARQSTPCERTKVVKIMTVLEAHPRLSISMSLSRQRITRHAKKWQAGDRVTCLLEFNAPEA